VGTTRLSEPWDQVFHLTDPDLRPGDSWRFMALIFMGIPQLIWLMMNGDFFHGD
jgi:hypothetical protein